MKVLSRQTSRVVNWLISRHQSDHRQLLKQARLSRRNWHPHRRSHLIEVRDDSL
jgi:hypothetical protein